MLKYVDAVSTHAADARRLTPESPLMSRADSCCKLPKHEVYYEVLLILNLYLSPDLSETLSGSREDKKV